MSAFAEDGERVDEGVECKHGVAGYASKATMENNINAACVVVGNGSGSLVDASKLGLSKYCVLTNHHVLGSADEARGATVTFHKDDADVSKWVEVKLDPAESFLAFRADPLDFCFVAVAAAAAVPGVLLVRTRTRILDAVVFFSEASLRSRIV